MKLTHRFALIVAACFLSGCASLFMAFNDDHESKVYAGTVIDARMVAANDAPTVWQVWRVFCLLDLPFSLVMDTVLLPYTVFTGHGEPAHEDEGRRAPTDDARDKP